MEKSCDASVEFNMAKEANEGNCEDAWRPDSRPQRELREMMKRNMLIFEEVAKEEEE